MNDIFYVRYLIISNGLHYDNTRIKDFEKKHIRIAWDETQEKWYFCINDVISVLTESTNPAEYFKKIRKRDIDLDMFVEAGSKVIFDPASQLYHVLLRRKRLSHENI